MINWNEVLKVAMFALASFIAGWAAAVLQDIVGIKAIATGLIPACAYIMGQRQEKVDLKS